MVDFVEQIEVCSLGLRIGCDFRQFGNDRTHKVFALIGVVILKANLGGSPSSHVGVAVVDRIALCGAQIHRRDGSGSFAADAPTMVQCVFPNSLREAHGASYAYISDWLAQHCSGGALPYVPHIVTIDNTDENLRSELGIPEDALVFG